MPTSFNNNYTELSAINGGNQLQNGDGVLAEHVNGALQNTGHFKELTDNKVVRRVYLQKNKLVLELATKNNESAVSVVSLEVSNDSLNAVAKVLSFGGWTATINNNGNSILLKVDGSENGYEFNIGRDELTYKSIVYDEESTIVDVTTYNLKRVPCFVKMQGGILGDEEIYINLYATKPILSVSDLLDNVPLNFPISATGHISGNNLVYSVSFTSSQITIHYGNNYEITRNLSDFTITSATKY